METIYFIDANSVGSVEKTFFDSFMQSSVVNDIEELKGDAILLLNNEQIEFFQKYSEQLSGDPLSVYYMKAPSIETLNEDIRKKREKAYQNTTDSLYMSYVKYKEFGDTEKATEAYNKWKQAVTEIGEANPYITEE